MSESGFSIQRRLDELCNEFEEKWSVEVQSAIGVFRQRIEEPYRDRLQQMLLEVDLELRQKAGQVVSPGDYKDLGQAAVDYVRGLLEVDSDETIPPNQSALSEDATIARMEQHQESSARQIGPYKLLQQIGEGGMGSVWMAEQEKPVRRRVALKLIRADIGSKEAIARFEAERQALAMMDHQNIAKVLDAGTTENGSPFFVMELVKGIPITQFCDDNKLSINERLELFVPVCKAVQHAHQKGIIHRDLKPSNVLVTLYDGEPVPKVIDFGLAKALEHTTKLTDKTMFTEFGKVVGTLQYMSPEQAEMNALDVDTRTDIYSLGVMLYELLTGSTPLDKDTLGKNALLQVLQIIREKEPPRPSHRLSSSGDTATGISQQRKIAPAKLQQILRGELDWIVMKSLEKDRSRRYESASNFAEDITRYLHDEPVTARPTSTAYRLRKFASKNRSLVTTAAVVASLLLIAVAVTSWFAYNANLAAQSEKLHKELANIEARRTRDALNIVTDAFQSTDPEFGARSDMSAKDILIRIWSHWNETPLDGPGKVILLRSLATSFFGLGEYASSINALTEQERICEKLYGVDAPETWDVRGELAAAYSANGNRQKAVEMFEDVVDHQSKSLSSDDPRILKSQIGLATAKIFTGEANSALQLFSDVIPIQSAKYGEDNDQVWKSKYWESVAYSFVGRNQEAIKHLEECAKAFERIHAPSHPSTLRAQLSLAISLSHEDNADDAIELMETVVKSLKEIGGNDHPWVLVGMSELGAMYHRIGRYEDAINEFEIVISIAKQKMPDQEVLLNTINRLALTLDEYWRIARQQGDIENAINALERLLTITVEDSTELSNALNSMRSSQK